MAIHYPDGGTERFIRDGAGNRIKHILPEQYDPATDDGAGYGYTYDAEDRLTRGFTSMTAYSKLSGFNASCTLQPPTMPR